MIGAVLAALAGAFCYALAAALQHHEAIRVRTRGTVNPRLLWQLARRPVWIAGIAASALGTALHLFALSRGPLTVVQPLGVTSLVFVVPLAAASGGYRVRLRELSAALILLTGLAGLLTVLPVGPGTGRVSSDPLAAVLVIVGVVTAAATVAAGRFVGRLRSMLLAAGAGTAFGATSALARLLLRTGGHLAFTVPTLLAAAGIAILAPLGFLLVQHAYRAGGCATALATITVADPLVAATCGVLLMGEPLPAAPAQGLVIAVAAVCVTVGIGLLASSPAQQLTRPYGAQAGQPRDPDDRRLRVLIGTDTYRPDVNGAAYFSHRLAAGLAARGHQVHVVCASATGIPSTGIEEGVTVHRLRSVRVPFHPTFRACPPVVVGAASRAVLRAVQPDVVHVQGHFLIGRALLAAAHRRRIPLLATNHFMPDNLADYLRLPQAVRPLACALAWRDFAHAFNRADTVTTPTPTAAGLIRGTGLRPPIQAISCGIDLARFHPHNTGGRLRALFGLPDRPTLLFVGRLEGDKRLHELVTALPQIRDHIDAQLVLVGAGIEHPRLTTLASQLRVADHVHFLGFIPDADLPTAYAVADVFCMPGTAELQSIATLEAMACGLPVVAADALALPHLVHPGVNGYLYPPGNLPALVGHVRELLASPQLCVQMGRASRQLASDHDATNTFAKFDDLYTQLAGFREPETASVGRAS